MGSQQRSFCCTCGALIVRERPPRWQDGIETPPGAKLNFVSRRPPPLLPSSLPPLPPLCSASLRLSPSLHPVKGMQNHICSFPFNQFFLFLRLSVLAEPPVSLSLSLSLPPPSCSDLFFLNFELNSPRLLSFQKVILHSGGSTLESVNTPFKRAGMIKDLHPSSPNSRIVSSARIV